MTFDDLRMALQIIASLTTILAFIGIGFKPVRTHVSKWLGELFTADIKGEMVTQIGTLRSDISKDRELSTKRHRANTRELKKIAFGLQVSNARLDEHVETGHGG